MISALLSFSFFLHSPVSGRAIFRIHFFAASLAFAIIGADEGLLALRSFCGALFFPVPVADGFQYMLTAF